MFSFFLFLFFGVDVRMLMFMMLLQEDNFAKEAAYNLSLIFVMTGAVPLAEKLYRQWLSI
jgi:hypothetical protein